MRFVSVATARLADEIVGDVAKVTGFKRSQLLGRDRHVTLARARCLTMLLLRDIVELSYPEIGLVLGKRDHTTAMSGVTRARNCLMIDMKGWRSDLKAIHAHIVGGPPKVRVDPSEVAREKRIRVPL